MKVLETERLVLRHFTAQDAPFALELLNEPAWRRFIGDRGVRTLEDARAYLQSKPIASYAMNGFGLYRVERKDDGAVLGTCGLVRRDGLEDVDIGFAFLERHWGRGYAIEAARAVLAYGFGPVGLERIVAVTLPENLRSIRVLEAIGLPFERMLRLPGDRAELRLHAARRPAAAAPTRP